MVVLGKGTIYFVKTSTTTQNYADSFFSHQERLEKTPSVCGIGHNGSHRPQHANVRP